MDWQPIETAPKDGTQVLLYVAEYEPPLFVGSFTYTELSKDHEDYWEGWSFAEEILSNHVDIEPEPTHWMPEPPK